ncbi:MAG TPA: sulfotransferase [Pyrinomonadaceae bacterium]|nr:sulfotransferase [Pyrinomonadaceae bacterium]
MARSGTSLLGRNIARLEGCTGFKNTGVYEDEGQFLQDVYLTASAYGGSSRCGFDPRAHRTETSDLLTQENIRRLRASWHAYWDNTKTIFVEKTPENLLMTRFLQAAFPNSYFVIVRRHPVPVSIAGQRWKVNVTSLYRMFEHWLHCHELFEEDKKYLKHVYELRYEDYVENPDKYNHEIARFIGTHVPEVPKEDTFRNVAQWRNPMGRRVPERAMEETSVAYNQKYLDRWRHLMTKSPFKTYYRYIAMKYESRIANYGYSLLAGLGMSDEELRPSKVSNAVGALCCIGADTGTFLQRLFVRSKPKVRTMAKAVLPTFVVDWIRHERQRQSSNLQRAQVKG